MIPSKEVLDLKRSYLRMVDARADELYRALNNADVARELGPDGFRRVEYQYNILSAESRRAGVEIAETLQFLKGWGLNPDAEVAR